jgi:pimeloyl-ACP methyl ester carboxylesterase
VPRGTVAARAAAWKPADVAVGPARRAQPPPHHRTSSVTPTGTSGTTSEAVVKSTSRGPLRRALAALVGPVPLTRERALGASERLCAVGSLTSSLEYLAQPELSREGGLNDWRLGRRAHVNRSRLTRKCLDVLGDERTTTALHVARAAASLCLLAPGNARWRGAANLFLGVSGAALQPRHRCGTDGSDQVSVLVQTSVGLARLSPAPWVKDTLMWYVALQATLSYAISGWVKLLGKPWRTGSALPNIMRTKTYGHEGFWRLTQKYPVPARFVAHGVLALECLFPLVYARGGLLTRPFVAGAASFHVANGLFMGLGRFVTAFTSMHPIVAYTTTPKDHPAVAGRDDRVLGTTLVLGAAAAGAAAAIAAARRARVTELPGGHRVTTRHGNELAYLRREPQDADAPVVVLSTGLTAPVEHFAWVLRELRAGGRLGVVTYHRAGYGPSTYRGGKPFTVQEAADDLADLVRHAVPDGRRVVLAGHSFGGEVSRRAAAELGDKVLAVAYLDSSHPAQLTRSEQQGESAGDVTRALRDFAVSARAGLGVLLSPPAWLEGLPEEFRAGAFAHYADARLWTAGQREWEAAEREFRSFTGDLPALATHALVLSAQQTVDRDPEHLLLHEEIAAAHRGPGRVVHHTVIEGADHESMLTDPLLGAGLGRRLTGFIDEITGSGREDAGHTQREDAR